MGILKLKKKKFYRHKSPIFLKNVDIGKVLVSTKISSGKKNYKYLIGYFYNDHKVNPLHIMLSKASIYIKHIKVMMKKLNGLLFEDDDLLEKYNAIWNKVSDHIKKEFDSEPVYNKKNYKNQNKLHIFTTSINFEYF